MFIEELLRGFNLNEQRFMKIIMIIKQTADHKKIIRVLFKKMSANNTIAFMEIIIERNP